MSVVDLEKYVVITAEYTDKNGDVVSFSMYVNKSSVDMDNFCSISLNEILKDIYSER